MPMQDGNPSSLLESHPELEEKSMFEVYKMFFDEDIENLFIENSNLYASVIGNDLTFNMNKEDLWDFFTIIAVSSYNLRTQFKHYWSLDDDLSCPLVRNIMPRNKFISIKRNLHVADNNNLAGNDKWAKLRPLFDAVNQKLLQFGVFIKMLSIDEQMVPYFGRHSCKMFIRGKPIRFGYKNWVLAGEDGYPFKIVPYQGKAFSESTMPLGYTVVNELLSVLSQPSNHEVFFDNFFTSISLLEKLREKGIQATGTIRSNRLKGTTLLDEKSLKKKNRGEMDVSSTEKLCTVRWVDNKVVTLASNHLTEAPVATCKRYDRKKRQVVQVSQPHLVAKYNKHMGGVDQLDNYLNNLRPAIGGKKWYWMQMINLIRLLQVAAYRLYSRLHSDQKISQQQFLRDIVKTYVQSVKGKYAHIEPDGRRMVPMEVNGHFAIPAKKQGRCRICKSNTTKACAACNVNLHSNKDCFAKFHTDG